MLAIIGGSGLTQLSTLESLRREVSRTPYGEPSGALTFGRLAGREVVFLARHGYGHTIPPHRVNYRANLWALKAAGAKSIVSVASVGGIRQDCVPGALIVPNQILDYTWGRAQTFFDDIDKRARHIDFTWPYDEGMRRRILAVADKTGVAMIDGAVYATMQGPRLETAAEVDRIERDGADVVGMTGMPEAALAREIELPYAAINVVANYAAGREASARGVRFESVEQVLQEAMLRVRGVLTHLCQQ
ncbi:MAG: S-methyl-5'-thioinosine phosphorylase [Azoarcus sp.]|nr:S-methyl-5'-thioinosine phosphorylase [Azoarcus sp.]